MSSNYVGDCHAPRSAVPVFSSCWSLPFSPVLKTSFPQEVLRGNVRPISGSGHPASSALQLCLVHSCCGRGRKGEGLEPRPCPCLSFCPNFLAPSDLGVHPLSSEQVSSQKSPPKVKSTPIALSRTTAGLVHRVRALVS